MDRRRFELQIDAVLVVLRVQRRSPDERSLAVVRRRSHEILDSLAGVAEGDPELEHRLAEAHLEVDAPIERR